MKKLGKIMIIFMLLIGINTKVIYADDISVERWRDSNGVWHYSSYGSYGTENVTSINTSSNVNILHIIIAGIIVIAICAGAIIILRNIYKNKKENKVKDDENDKN